ncbi:NAD-dependent succinate-semialdehyde dehydrogenase [Halomonas sp. M5N1S17]|nr:NAD-dependent succinate-semialdehyde dehydrogenase [Halomonas alkalisoli]MCE9665593.1 NAD-dependent succinate-semialdehyde dehydrogenase [Halomonas alkalisoli]
MQLKDPGLLKTQAYIDGQWVAGTDGDSFEVTNPATGDVIAKVANVGAAEARFAIEAAHRALPAWQAKTAKQRSVILRRWHDLMLEHQDDLALIMTCEQGKPLAEARGEVAYGASFIEWFAEEAKRVYGDVIPTFAHDRRLVTIKQPVGVVAAITPWNFPNAMLARKAAPALAVGCTFVMKPAKETPLSALAMVELAERAGVPAGVLNLVVGESSSEIGNELTGNPLVRKVTFTGSTPVGKQLLKQCAESVKKVSMELGGNAPIIVFDDADLDQAVTGALASKYRNAGQTCICANRILVQEGIYDAFVEKFTAAVSELKVGNGLDENVTMGPLVSERAVREVHEKVEEALAQGARATIGGTPDSQGACFYRPTVLVDVDSDMRVFREEIFGPVAPIFRFKDEADAIAMANDTEVGLASYLYTRDLGCAWRVSEGLEYGMVGVNEVGISSEVIPFGGIKESGLGREGSKYGLEDYLEVKYICMGGLDS